MIPAVILAMILTLILSRYSGGYDNSILSFSPFDDQYFGMMDISGSAVSGMWTSDKTQQFANFTGSWSSISTKRKISIIGEALVQSLQPPLLFNVKSSKAYNLSYYLRPPVVC